MGARPLPQPGIYQQQQQSQGGGLRSEQTSGNSNEYSSYSNSEAIWYEAQERNRPSYVAPYELVRQTQQQPILSAYASASSLASSNSSGARGAAHPSAWPAAAPYSTGTSQAQLAQAGQTPAALPPLSPSARYNQQPPAPTSFPFPQAQYSYNQSKLPPGAAPPLSVPPAGFVAATVRTPRKTAPAASPSTTSSNRNSFSGNLAALAGQATSRLRRNSNTNNHNNLAYPLRSQQDVFGTGQQQQQQSWARTTGASGQKGSVFMHKGFWDIMSLANNTNSNTNSSSNQADGLLAAPRFPGDHYGNSYEPSSVGASPSGSRPSSPSKFKTTLSKATTALRRMSGAGPTGAGGNGVGLAAAQPSFPYGATATAGLMTTTTTAAAAAAAAASQNQQQHQHHNDESSEGPAFDMVRTNTNDLEAYGAGGALAIASQSPLSYAAPGAFPSATPHSNSNSGGGGGSSRSSIDAFPAHLSAAPPLVRAAKKRISVDMVSCPQPGTFVHAAHASDAEQAAALLRRWARDGVGAVAARAWAEPITSTVRTLRQAEAVAQVQAALHADDSLILQQGGGGGGAAMAGGRAPLQVVNGTSTFTASTVTTAAGTVGHGANNTLKAFQQVQSTAVIEGPGQLSPPPPLPRTNTSGTLVMSPPSPGLDGRQQQQPVPDYMRFNFNPSAAGHGSVLRIDTTTAKPGTAAKYDGLPGAAPAAIGALFEQVAPIASAAPPDRPLSMIMRDSALPAPTSAAPSASASRLLASSASGTAAETTVQGSALLAAALGTTIRPSLTTVEKSVAAKIYFENLYYGILKKPRARDARRAGLEAELAALRLSESAKAAIRARWAANETEHLREVRARVSVNSFVKLKTIGHGAFGVVALVRERGTGQLLAMKQLRKADMLRKGQEGHVRAERDLMTSASASANAKWIVKLIYSFQDSDHLYLIM